MTDESRLRPWHVFCVLSATLLVVYSPALTGGLVWDDDRHVGTATMRDLAGLARIWTEPSASQQYYPLTQTSFWLEYQLYGSHTLGYHLVNVLLHALSATLLFVIARRLRLQGAAFAAALFAFHPLQVESVAWITERKNCLAGVLAALSVLAFLAWLEATEASARRRYYALAAVCFGLALLAKTAVATLPAVFLVLLVARNGRRPSAAAWAALAPFFVTGVGAGLFTSWLERHQVGATGAEFALSPLQRVWVAGRTFWFYPSKWLFPFKLEFVYPRFALGVSTALALLPVLLALLLLAGLYLGRGRVGRGPLVVASCYGALIFPALHLFPVYFARFSFVQDHFQYFAFAPFALGSGHLLGLKVRGLARQALSLALALGLAVLSFQRAGTFSSYEALFEQATRTNPAAWMAQYNLSLRYLAQHRAQAALPHLEAMLRVRPDAADGLTALGDALFQVGRAQEGLRAFEHAARAQPEWDLTWSNLAKAYVRLGRPKPAAEAYEHAMAVHPRWTRIEREYAWLLATTSDPALRSGERAVTLATEACSRTKLELARCWDTLAVALGEAGRYESAVETAERALRQAKPASAPRIAAHLEKLKRHEPIRDGLAE